MALAIAAANAPSLAGWFDHGLAPRMVDEDQAPYPILHARNTSATPTTRGNTVNWFMDSMHEDVEFAASIVTVCADKTVIAIRCTSAPASVASDCGPVATVTQGVSHYEFEITGTTTYQGHDVTAYGHESCNLGGTTAATCTATVGGAVDGTKTATTAVITVASPTYYRFDVEITGGAEKTKNPAATCSVEGAASSLNSKTMAIWALTGTFGVASLLTML